MYMCICECVTRGFYSFESNRINNIFSNFTMSNDILYTFSDDSSTPIPSSSVEDFSLWNEILEEAEVEYRAYKQFKNEKSPPDPHPVDTETMMEFLDRTVMPILLVGLEDTLHQAIEWNCLEIQKCRFNGVDNIAEILWNLNPLYPERRECWTSLFDIPMVKDILREHPRPIYPKSWLWTEDEAACIIQAAVRSFLLRCQPEVQEMRQFWKIMRQLAVEKKLQAEEEERERLQQEEERRRREHEENIAMLYPITEDIMDHFAVTVRKHEMRKSVLKERAIKQLQAAKQKPKES